MINVSRLLFASRWIQLPLYVGLVVAQVIYVFQFWRELAHLVEAVMGHPGALEALVKGIGYRSDVPITELNESIVMLVVLGLIDV
ncbi:MAG: TIGR00645 family protein, partial [Limnohabitans sp.]|nr:TIGR00645 family protein [Limnohabitans sp.]